jgi:hypothetical protein
VSVLQKIKPGLGVGGDQVPYLDGDATCPRDQPTCDSGEFTNKEVSVRVGFLGPMDQGAVPTRSGSVRFPACIHNTNPAWNVGSVFLVRYAVNFCTVQPGGQKRGWGGGGGVRGGWGGNPKRSQRPGCAWSRGFLESLLWSLQCVPRWC